MENQRKIPKRIFSLFLAILCIFGIFFVSYIDSFAETYYFESTSFPGSDYEFPSTSFVDDVVFATLIHNTWGTRTFNILSSSSSVYYVGVINDNTYGYSGPLFFSSSDFTINDSNVHASTFTYNSLRVYYYASNWVANPTSLSPSPYVHISITASIHSVYIPRFAWLLLNSVVNPTPSPIPTPTPAPATPTPDPYGPGPVPTIPPGEANYTSFFNRLASDAQNAFNAIFLSWQNANNKFYSGLFFIGFPVLLGIIGLVASIFFGDDD